MRILSIIFACLSVSAFAQFSTGGNAGNVVTILKQGKPMIGALASVLESAGGGKFPAGDNFRPFFDKICVVLPPL